MYEEEPLLSGNPFEGLVNVTYVLNPLPEQLRVVAKFLLRLTPHMAYNEEETMKIWWEETKENVLSWLNDGGSHAKAQGRELLSE